MYVNEKVSTKIHWKSKLSMIKNRFECKTRVCLTKQNKNKTHSLHILQFNKRLYLLLSYYFSIILSIFIFNSPLRSQLTHLGFGFFPHSSLSLSLFFWLGSIPRLIDRIYITPLNLQDAMTNSNGSNDSTNERINISTTETLAK